MSVGKVVKFVLLCLVVGIVATAFGIGVEDFWRWVVDNAKGAGQWIATQSEWAIGYILIGAGILVPIYLVVYVYRRVKDR